MVSSRQREQYEQVLASITKTRPSCRHAQCFAFNKKQTRCQMCLNVNRARESRTPRCHLHHGKPDKLNRFSERRGAFVYGFDPALLNSSRKKFADDAIQTALKVFAAKASERRIQIGWLSERTSYDIEYVNPRPARWYCYICNLDDHWFTILMQNRQEIYVFNSLAGGFNVSEERIRRLRGMSGFYGQAIQVTELPQQENELDCGAFAICYAYCYIYNQPLPAQAVTRDPRTSTPVRHAVVLFLLAKDPNFLRELCNA